MPRNLMQRDKQASLKGIFNITVTPFAGDGSIDYATLAKSIERVVGLGYDGILIGGTYGEFPTMSPQERAELFRRSIDCAAAAGSRFASWARRYGQPQTVKAAMAYRGWGNGLVRSPSLPLTPAQRNEVAEATDTISRAV